MPRYCAPWSAEAGSTSTPETNRRQCRLIGREQAARHRRFQGGSPCPEHKMLGSGVIARRARSLITVKESEHERFLQVTKRLGYKKKEKTLIGYRFGDDERLEFYAVGSENTVKTSTRETVIRFLRDFLADGPRERDDVFREAEKRGITRDNLYDYKDDSGVISIRVGGNRTAWKLSLKG